MTHDYFNNPVMRELVRQEELRRALLGGSALERAVEATRFLAQHQAIAHELEVLASGGAAQALVDLANSGVTRELTELAKGSALQQALELSLFAGEDKNRLIDSVGLLAGAELSSMSLALQQAALPTGLDAEVTRFTRELESLGPPFAFLDGSLSGLIRESWLGDMPDDSNESAGEDDDVDEDAADSQLVVVGGWLTRQLLQRFSERPDEMTSLSPGDFEELVIHLMEMQGFDVTRTGGVNTADGGLDFIAVRKDSTFDAIPIGGQVKHHQGRRGTGSDAVRSLLSWQLQEGVGLGLLVTNTHFTPDAKHVASKQPARKFLRLRDQEALARWCAGDFASTEERRELPDQLELTSKRNVEVPGGSCLKLWTPGSPSRGE